MAETFLIEPGLPADFVMLAGPEEDKDRILDYSDHAFGIRDDGGVLRGVAATWVDKFHPYNLKVAVVAPHPMPAFCEFLWHELESLSRQAGMHGFVIETSTATSPLIQRLQQMGLHEVNNTRTPSFSTADWHIPAAQESSGEAWTISAVEVNEVLKNALIDRHYRAYREANKDNPITAFDPERWQQVVLPNIVDDLPCVWIDDHEIKAFLLFYTTDRSDTIDFGYAWGANDVAFSALLPVTLSSLRDRFQRVNGEFDDSDPWGTKFAQQLGAKDAPVAWTSFKATLGKTN